jgi:hypothetical protein
MNVLFHNICRIAEHVRDDLNCSCGKADSVLLPVPKTKTFGNRAPVREGRQEDHNVENLVGAANEVERARC